MREVDFCRGSNAIAPTFTQIPRWRLWGPGSPALLEPEPGSHRVQLEGSTCDDAYTLVCGTKRASRCLVSFGEGTFRYAGTSSFTEVKSHNGVSHLKRTGQWRLVHSFFFFLLK